MKKPLQNLSVSFCFFAAQVVSAAGISIPATSGKIQNLGASLPMGITVQLECSRNSREWIAQKYIELKVAGDGSFQVPAISLSDLDPSDLHDYFNDDAEELKKAQLKDSDFSISVQFETSKGGETNTWERVFKNQQDYINFMSADLTAVRKSNLALNIIPAGGQSFSQWYSSNIKPGEYISASINIGTDLGSEVYYSVVINSPESAAVFKDVILNISKPGDHVRYGVDLYIVGGHVHLYGFTGTAEDLAFPDSLTVQLPTQSQIDDMRIGVKNNLSH